MKNSDRARKTGSTQRVERTELLVGICIGYCRPRFNLKLGLYISQEVKVGMGAARQRESTECVPNFAMQDHALRSVKQESAHLQSSTYMYQLSKSDGLPQESFTQNDALRLAHSLWVGESVLAFSWRGWSDDHD